MRKKLFIVMLLIVIVGTTVSTYKAESYDVKQMNSYSENRGEEYEIDRGIIQYHEEIYNDMLEEFSLGNWTIDNPYVNLDPYKSSPLSAVVGVKASEPSKLTIVIKGLDDKPDFVHEFEEYNIEFFVPLLGLYENVENEVTFLLTTTDGVESTNSVYIETQEVPNDFGEFTITNPVDEADLHNEFYFSSSFTGYMNAIDLYGNVRWYIYQTDENFTPFFDSTNFSYFFQMENGHYLAEDNQHRAIVELDSLGRIYEITEVDFDIHHEFLELEDGNYLVQSQVDDASTIEDLITVVEKGTGEYLETYDYKDIIDVTRPAQPYSENDWLHANSIDIDENNNSIITSSRHQNAVFSVDRDSKELEWIIGSHINWKPEYIDHLLTPVDELGNELYDFTDPEQVAIADLEFWNWGQHSAKVISTNNNIVQILLFNNNTYGTYIDENWIHSYENHSEPRIYEVDTELMTVKRIWTANENGDSEHYSGYVGSVRLNDNKVLTNYGATNEALNYGINVGNADDVPMDNFTSDMYFSEPIQTTARIVEYDYDTKEIYFGFTYTDPVKLELYDNGIFAVNRYSIYGD